jgi:deoxyribose-phosphate aldolase
MARTADDVEALCRALAEEVGKTPGGGLRGYRTVRPIVRAGGVLLLAARVGFAMAPLLTVRWRRRLVSAVRGAAR